jgi:hypothetical protein
VIQGVTNPASTATMLALLQSLVPLEQSTMTTHIRPAVR